MDSLKLKFKSGNSVPVSHAIITREEYCNILNVEDALEDCSSDLKMAQDKIAELKKDNQILQIFNNSTEKIMADSLELIAHVNRLRAFINEAMLEQQHPFSASILQTALESTPAQSLATIRAEAIELAATAFTLPTNDCENVVLLSDLLEYAEQLRKEK